MTDLSYPGTRNRAGPIVNLTTRGERVRLSPAALKAFFNIIGRWQVRDEEACRLLGGVSNGTYDDVKKDPEGRVLDVGELHRVSYLIGIFKALNILHPQALADEWVRLSNANPVFGGATPLAYMITGGLPAMQTVRRLLDSRLEGL